MSSPDATHLKKPSITSSSGVLQTHYGKEWGRRKERNIESKIEYETPHAVIGTTDLGTPATFLLTEFRDVTTAIVIPSISPRKEIIRYWQNETLKDIKSKISRQFFVLRERKDNWDDLGSKKPNVISLSNAVEIIRHFLDLVIDAGYLWLTPLISSDEDGNITIEWHKGQYELHIEVRKNETEYIKVWGSNIESEMHLDFLNSNDYLLLWKWLLRG